MNAVKTNQKGFSIIEVVLVLAIAGLIFLMVFVALPALQRSQRDQARRSDVGIVGSAVSSYASNNRGTLPTLAQLTPYVQNLSQFDKDSEIRVSAGVTTGPSERNNVIMVNTGVKCNGSNVTATGASKRQATVRVLLESGGNQVFCQDV